MTQTYKVPMKYEARLTELGPRQDGGGSEWEVRVYEIDPAGAERKQSLDFCESLDEARESAVKMLAQIRGYSEVIR